MKRFVPIIIVGLAGTTLFAQMHGSGDMMGDQGSQGSMMGTNQSHQMMSGQMMGQDMMHHMSGMV
jgi:hypothetical protein